MELGIGSGVVNDKTIGLNFGGQWTDGTGQNENGIVVDGVLHKLDDDIKWQYDKKDYMRPWLLQTAQTKAVDLSFVPLFERKAITKAVVIQSAVHQMIGHFSGTVTTPAGEQLKIDSMLGWAEDHVARW